jgi:hypothetical protein
MKDSVKMDGFLSSVFDLSEVDPPNDRYLRLGYKSSNFMEVSGIVLMSVSSSFLVLAAYTLWKRTSKKHFKEEKVRKVASLIHHYYDKNVSEGLVTQLNLYYLNLCVASMLTMW